MGNIDDFVDKLQEQIFDEAREALGDKGFQRWRNPRFAGKLDNYNANGCVTGSCGDTMEMFFQIQENRVQNGSYTTNGCASSSISGSFAVELAMGKTVEQLADINGEQVLDKIGKLPPEDRHCAFLAAETIQGAVTGYMNDAVKNNPGRGQN